jgi:uncharacterized protein YhjY with autotransporter beta-barrel domain
MYDQTNAFLTQRFLELDKRMFCFRERPCNEICERYGRISPCAPLCDPSYNWYVGPIVTKGNVRSKEEQVRSELTASGIINGFEAVGPRYSWGWNFIYEKSWVDVKKGWGDFDFNHFSFNVYQDGYLCDWDLHHLFMGGNVGFSINDYDVLRRDSGAELLSDPFGYEIYISTDLNYLFIQRSSVIGAFIGIRYDHARIEDYEEEGNHQFRLKFSKQTGNSLRTRLGANWSREIFSGSWVWIPYLGAEWQREFMDYNRSVRAFSDFSGQQTRITLHRSGRDFFLFSTALELSTRPGFSVKAEYDLEYNNRSSVNFFNFNLIWRF